ncbi:Uncharacterised protein [Escherichia coli]|uniref:Uncharacterized protein n=1 Tax=Escherichia coli TaxID=562 RepID=A0A2X1K8U7_ECOLX|nr:Uncharacterised protein [Escherichia coli]
MNCQTKNQFNYKDNSYVFVLERGGAWCYDYTVSVVNLKTGKAQMIEYGDNQLCSGSNKPFFEIKKWRTDGRSHRHIRKTCRCSPGQT